MYFVYVLKSLSTGRYYKGFTRSIESRLKEHNSGNVQTTRSLRPLTLIHVELCSTREEARRLEKYFKSGFGREIIKEIVEG